MIAGEYPTVVNKSSVTVFRAVRISLTDCKVLEQEIRLNTKLQLHKEDREVTDLCSHSHLFLGTSSWKNQDHAQA